MTGSIGGINESQGPQDIDKVTKAEKKKLSNLVDKMASSMSSSHSAGIEKLYQKIKQKFKKFAAKTPKGKVEDMEIKGATKQSKVKALKKWFNSFVTKGNISQVFRKLKEIINKPRYKSKKEFTTKETIKRDIPETLKDVSIKDSSSGPQGDFQEVDLTDDEINLVDGNIEQNQDEYKA